jgi:hypothetical protein
MARKCFVAGTRFEPNPWYGCGGGDDDDWPFHTPFV